MILIGTSVGSSTPAKDTYHTPCEKPSTFDLARCNARRDLPLPPAPTSVKRRTSSCSNKRVNRSTAHSRPMSRVFGIGRLCLGKYMEVRELLEPKVCVLLASSWLRGGRCHSSERK